MAIPKAFASLFLVLLLVCPLCCMARDVLYPGESLKSGQYLTAGSYKFKMQEDCDLVLLDGTQKPRWTSGTAGLGKSCYLSFKTDGEMVICDKNNNNKVVWKKRRPSLVQGNYVLILEQIGEVVIYGPNRYPTNIRVTSFGPFGALPANKAAEEAKAANISMVVTN